MNYRQGLKALGLSLLAALGLMALTASGAQASGTFLIEGLSPPWQAEVTGQGENILESYLQVLKLNVKLGCHVVQAAGSINNVGHGHGLLYFTECLATDSEGNVGECEFLEPLEARVLILVILHSDSKPYMLFSPLVGSVLLAIKEHNLFCPFLLDGGITGSVVASISNPNGDDVTKLISSKNMLLLFPADKLFFGAHEVHLSADGLVSLAGKLSGLKWGAA